MSLWFNTKKRDWSLDFLPEYQAIMKTPPAGVGRFLGMAICFLLLLLIGWACFFHMDILATAHGKLIADTGSHRVHAPVLAEVEEVHVKAGDRVKAGDLLMTLEGQQLKAKGKMLDALIKQTEIDIARLKALQAEEPENALQLPDGLSAEEVSQARDRLRTSLYYYNVQVDALSQVPRKDNEPKLANPELRVKSFKSEFQEKVQNQAGNLMKKRIELKAQRTEVREALDSLSIRSPVDGRVQEMQVTSKGAVVKPAQPLMLIVPAAAFLHAKVMISSKDRGFVKEGQAVKIKVDSFPYTRYGMLEGQLQFIAKDAVVSREQGLLFPAIVSFDTQSIQVGSEWVQLLAGMQVTCEIKTGKRRIISYLLSPLQTYQDETLRER